MKEICVWSKIPNLVKELRKVLPQLSFHEISTVEDEHLQRSEILISDFDDVAPHLYRLGRIKWMQGTWAGVDFLMPYVKPGQEVPLKITRFSGQHFGRIMTEYIVATIVMHERRWPTVMDRQKSGLWIKDDSVTNYRTISDLHVGIMGIGNIGNKIGQYLHALGAKVFGYGRSEVRKVEDDYLTAYYSKPALSAFLRSCDYLINVLPHTEDTAGLLNGNTLENCKSRQAVFVNIGRGSVVKEGDLISALDSGWISHAHLDVFPVEPLPKESPLWKMPNVSITPHVAGMSRPQDIAQQFHDNYLLHLNNERIPTEVDVNRRY